MKIYIGSDHNGYGLKHNLVEYLQRAGYDVEDMGDDHLDPNDDFPVYAARVATAVLGSDNADPRGIVLCGSGQGVCMTVNRYKGIRGSLCWDRKSAREARNDDDANVLCLPAKELSYDDAKLITETWLTVKFANAPRFIRRIKEMDNL